MFQHGWHSGIPLAQQRDVVRETATSSFSLVGRIARMIAVEWRTSAQTPSISRCARVFGLDEKVGPGDLPVAVTGSGFGGTLANVSDNAVDEQVHFGELRGLIR
jgi:hypothetical protein